MKTKSLQAHRDRKAGRITPEIIMEELNEIGPIDGLIFIARSDDAVYIGRNTDLIETLGLLEYASYKIMEEADE